MAKYRKKPVVIEAVRYDGTEESVLKIMQLQSGTFKRVFVDNKGLNLRIVTDRGTVRVEKGDYVVKGEGGELFSCKPRAFKEMYQVANK